MAVNAVKPLAPQSIEGFSLSRVIYFYNEELSTGCKGTRTKRASDLAELYKFISSRTATPSMDDLTRNNLDDWVQSLRHKALKPSTLEAKVNSLNAFLKAVHERWHWQGVRRLKAPRIASQEFKSLTPQQLDLFLDVLAKHETRDPFCAVRDRFALLSLLYTGLRRAELLSVIYSQLSDDRQYIFDVRCKGEKYRDIYLSAQVQPVLREYLAARESELTARDGNYTRQRGSYPLVVGIWYAKPGVPESFAWSVESFYRVCHELMLEAGIPKQLAHPHTLRHCLGKKLCDKKGIRLAAHALGHSSIQTTMRYTTPAQHELEAALDEE